MLDLHMHSTASDGSEDPAALVEKCAKLRLQLCAITDHDTIDSQEAAMAMAKKKKQPYITGVEFSVKHTGELHILGYGIDATGNPGFLATMRELKNSRVERVHEILRRLRQHNIDIPYEDVRFHAAGNTLGRPHVALALIQRGYAADMQEAFGKYLNEEGLCYVRRRKLSARDALELIHSTGGTAVLAHPKFIRTDDLPGLVRTLTQQGLNGIETYYPAHTDADVRRFLHIAEENKLLVTAGSDYHGAIRPYIAIACEKRTGPMLEESIRHLIQKYVD